MVLYIGGIKIKTYSSDTRDTIIRRISIALNTLPNFLRVINLDVEQAKDKKNILDLEIKDLLQEIRNSYETYSISFTDFYSTIQEDWANIPRILVYKLWLSMHPLSNPATKLMLSTELETLAKQSEEFATIDLDSFISNKDGFILDTITIPLQTLKKEENDWKKIGKVFQKEEELKHSSFYVRDTIIEIRYKTTKPLLNIFDNLTLTRDIPIASCNGYFKILRGFIPTPEMLQSTNDKIFARFDNRLVIMMKEDTFTLLIAVQIYEEGNVAENLQKIYALLPKFDFVSSATISENKVEGTFYFPNFILTSYIFSDLVMNDEIVSNFLIVNERTKAHKKHDELYIHYKNVRATITQQVSEIGSPDIKILNPEDKSDFPMGSSFVRILVTRGSKKEEINEFITDLAKIMSIYIRKKKDIYKIYKSFDSSLKIDVARESRKFIREKVMLKDIEPNVFPTGYTRFCPRPPDIVEQENPTTAIFPKSPDEGTQHIYSCSSHEKYPYFGLKENNLPNSDTYPYLPCCYAVDQRERKGSAYKKYYEGSTEESKGEQQRLITTNKISHWDTKAYLPKNLARFFEAIGNMNSYVRCGVTRSKNSFLESVVLALSKDRIENDKIHPDFISLEEKEREENIQELRASLLEYETLEIVRQEMYDYSLDDIRKEIANEEEYLDPRKYVRLIENVFQVNIVLFNREKNSVFGNILIPRHIQNYYTFSPRFTNTIIIYEHYGMESDKATYPQCEFVIWWKDDGTSECVFDKDNDFVIELYRVFNTMNNSFVGEIPLLPTDYEEVYDNVISQDIDEYGKTRIIEIDGLFIELFSPIPPLPKPIAKLNNKISEVSDSCEILAQYSSNNRVNRLKIKYKNIEGYVIVREQDVIEDIDIERDNVSNTNKKSLLSSYTRLKKLSFIIYEYVKHEYSKFIHENKLKMNENSIDNFFKNRVDIVENYTYLKNLGCLITRNKDKNVVYNDKVVLPNNEVKARIRAQLSQDIIHYSEAILNYYTKTYIDNYYQNISDFVRRENELLIFGDNVVQNMFNYYVSEHIAKSIPNSDEKGVYYMINDKLKNLYLCKNVDSVKEGLIVGKYWYEEGYILSDKEISEIKEVENISYTIKITDLNYSEFKRVRGDSNYNVLILATKNEAVMDKVFLTVCLRL